MSARWDDIEILQAIDRMQQMFGGGSLAMHNGLYLMNEINGSNVSDHQRWRGFVQELHIARDLGLLTFTVRPDPTPNVADANPEWYLQTLSDFALTVKGQDRARGRVVNQPLPDPAEDDGRKISNLILKQIAEAIMEQYAPDEVAEFLSDEGIPPAELRLPEDTEEGDAYVILTNLWRWGSEGRRLVRRFIGRWLDDMLLTGPDVELRALLIDQLARQGWSVRDTDSILVVSDPVRGVPATAPYLRSSRLHVLIDAEARPQFLIKQVDKAVFASMKAVEVRVRKLGGFSDQEFGVSLMNSAFGPNGPLTDTSVGKGEQDGTRQFFAGAYAVLRNPAGHREVNYGDMSEAAEAVGTASLLMRILDRIEERIIQAGRSAVSSRNTNRTVAGK